MGRYDTSPANKLRFDLIHINRCTPWPDFQILVWTIQLDYAMTHVGDPYVSGEQSSGGFDCSGLVIWAYKQAHPGLRLRRGSEIVEDATQDNLWRYNVVRIPPNEMRPGDVVFITNDRDRMTHGGLFIRWVGDGQDEFRFINASSFYQIVKVDTWPVDERKRGQWFAGAGRLQTVS